MPDGDGSSTTSTNNKNIFLRCRRCCYCYCCLSPLIPILLETTKIIFIENPRLFFIIYVLTTFPLSLLLTSLSLSSRSLKLRIAHLEWLANVVPTWVEADNVRAEARIDLGYLFRNKALYAGPIVIFSLLALVPAVSAAIACRKKQRFTIRNAIVAVRVTWVRPFLTCVVSCLVLVTWGLVMHVINAVAGYPASVVVTVAGAAAEVYVMAVLSLAMVVSVAEERAGVDAVRAGLGLMRGRRVVGWVLSGLVLMGSGCIGWEMEGLMKGQDYLGMNLMKVGYMGGLAGLLGWVVLWSYVVVTVFYCDCRKRHVIRSREEDNVIINADDDDNEV